MPGTISIRGKKVRERRERAGVNREEFAVRMGMSLSGVYKIEREDIASVFLSKRPKLIAALGITDAVFDSEILVDARPLARTTAPDNLMFKVSVPVATFNRLVKLFRGKSQVEEWLATLAAEKAREKK